MTPSLASAAIAGQVRPAASSASCVVAADPEMARVVAPGAGLERVYSGGKWCEGPVWSQRSGRLVFSDVRRNTLLSLDSGGQASVLRSPSNFANGNAIDADGRLISCEHLGRRLVREEADGRLTVLAERYDGRRLNSPNDLVIAADGAVWFTDPTYGLQMPEEGRMAAAEQRGRFVFRLDPGGSLEPVADSFEQPNGIAFAPDQRTLYVSDSSGGSGREGKREIRAFDVVGGRRLARERVFARLESGAPDGLETDAAGRVYACCGGDGVRVWRADGSPLGRIATPAVSANLAFGGSDGKRLFVCTGETVHAITLGVAGSGFRASRKLA